DSSTNLTDPLGLATLPAWVPALGGAGSRLTLITGGGGAAAPTFTLVAGGSAETGLAGGPVGVLVGGAGAVGWGIGRGVGHIPIGGGWTVDDGWTAIGIATVFSPDPNPYPGAGPAFNPNGKPSRAPSLAGRYTGGRPATDDDDDCAKEWGDALEFCAK